MNSTPVIPEQTKCYFSIKKTYQELYFISRCYIEKSQMQQRYSLESYNADDFSI